MRNKIALAACLLWACGSPSALAETEFSPWVDKQGNISLPPDFRATMAHLGSWFVPAGEASGFHDVYIDRASLQAYRENGNFPDGAALVKELRSHETGDFTTGSNVSYANKGIKQWFVMIKDTKGRFVGNPIWGEGWGWALFKPDDSSRNVATNFQTDCLACHVPAKNNDWVYTEGYPSLQAP